MAAPVATRRRRRLALRVFATAVLLCAGACAAVFAARSGSQPRPVLQARGDGSIVFTNSLDGRAILRVENAGPGDRAEGSVTLANRGSLPGALTLAASLPQDSGPQGAPDLSSQLLLSIDDVSGGGESPVYSGPLAGTPRELDLLTLVPGDARTYRFVVTVPSDLDSRSQESSTFVDYEWTCLLYTSPSPRDS